MSTEVEEAVMIEPDMQKSSGCGCNKNKISDEGQGVIKKNQTLSIVLIVIFIGTIVYMLRKKKVVPIEV